MLSVLFIPPRTTPEKENLFRDAHGARVYDMRPVPPADPQDVYMLYLSVRDGGFFRRQYRCRRGTETANVIAKELFSYAKEYKNKFEVGEDLIGIEWSSPCHLYIVVYITDCKFVKKPDNEKFDPLHFHESKDLIYIERKFYFDKNASFYDGEVLADDVVGAPAFRCINHFIDEDKKPIRHPRLRTYGFEIRYQAPSGELEIVDPDGQNQGPPS